jgi:hypothetical protein
MSAPLKELFVKLYGEFDHKAFDEAQSSTERLKTSLGQLPQQTNQAGAAQNDFATQLLHTAAATNFGASMLQKLSGLYETYKDRLTVTNIVYGHTLLQWIKSKPILRHLVSGFDEANTSITGLAKHLINANIANVILMGTIAVMTVALPVWIMLLNGVRESIMRWIDGMATAGRTLASLATRTDISAHSIAAWSQAARLANVSANRLEGALTDLSTKIGEALTERGSGAARMFRQLGLSMDDLRNMSTEEVFYNIADQIRATTDQTRRMHLVNRVFGGGARDLLPILQGGAQALREQNRQLKEAQPGFREYIRNSLLIGQAQARMGQAMDGAGQILMNMLAPAVIWTTNKLVELVKWFNNSTQAQDIVRAGLIGIAAALGAVTLALVAASASVGLFFTFVVPIIPILAAVAMAIGVVIYAVQDFYTFLQGGDSIFGRFIFFLTQIPTVLSVWAQSFLQANTFLGTFLDGLSSVINQMLTLYNLYRQFQGLPPISVDLRRSAVQGLSNLRQSEEGSNLAVRGLQRTLADRFGVDQYYQDPNKRPTFSLAPGIGPSPAAIQGAAGGAKSVNQTVQATFNITEATDLDGVRQVIQDAMNSANRQLVDLVGGGN